MDFQPDRLLHIRQFHHIVAGPFFRAGLLFRIHPTPAAREESGRRLGRVFRDSDLERLGVPAIVVIGAAIRYPIPPDPAIPYERFDIAGLAACVADLPIRVPQNGDIRFAAGGEGFDPLARIRFESGSLRSAGLLGGSVPKNRQTRCPFSTMSEKSNRAGLSRV